MSCFGPAEPHPRQCTQYAWQMPHAVEQTRRPNSMYMPTSDRIEAYNHHSHTSMTIPHAQMKQYTAQQDIFAHKDDMKQTPKRIAIDDLINPTTAGSTSMYPTVMALRSATSPTDPPSSAFLGRPDSLPAQFTPINTIHQFGSIPGVTAVQRYQPRTTADYRQWTMPKPDSRPPSPYSSDCDRPSQAPQEDVLALSPSQASSPASFHSSIALMPPAAVAEQASVRHKDYDFALSFRQQPLAARACGLGDRDRRTIDPPPILELKITDRATGYPTLDHNATLVLHCELRDTNGGPLTHLSQNNDESRPVLAMMGNSVASPFTAKDERGIAGVFFILSDLSCRFPERYRLHFQLLRLEGQALRSSQVTATALSEPFTVYTAKDFPGMRESTPLLKHLRRQGLTVGLKKGSEARKRKHEMRRMSPPAQASTSGSEEPSKRRKIAA